MSRVLSHLDSGHLSQQPQETDPTHKASTQQRLGREALRHRASSCIHAKPMKSDSVSSTDPSAQAAAGRIADNLGPLERSLWTQNHWERGLVLGVQSCREQRLAARNWAPVGAPVPSVVWEARPRCGHRLRPHREQQTMGTPQTFPITALLRDSRR